MLFTSPTQFAVLALCLVAGWIFGLASHPGGKKAKLRLREVEALEDGRYNVVLEGVAMFRIVRELDVTTPFRQVEAELLPVIEDDTLSLGRRSSLELESRRFADVQGYAVDWDAVARLDDESLVNGIAQIAPFDSAAKQALLEARDVETRAELIIQLMQFFGRHDGDEQVTLQ